MARPFQMASRQIQRTFFPPFFFLTFQLVLKIDQTITTLGLKLQPRVQHILMDNK